MLARSESERQEAAKNTGTAILEWLAKVGKSGDSTLPMNNATQVINDLRDNPEAVQQALDNREAIEAQRRAEADRLQQWANEHKGAATAASVVSSPLSMVDYLQQLVEVNAVGHSLPSENLKPAEITQGLREGVSQDMSNAGKFLYNTAMSYADSLVGNALSGGISGVGAFILGGGAASSAINDIKERGGSDQQAILGGTAAGAFEWFFEKYSLGQLNALKEMPVDSAKTVLKNMAKSVFTNASEETATELANVLFDGFLMQDLSNYSLMVQNLMKNGYNQSDAERLAKIELAKQVGLAGLAGGLMGVASGGIGSLGGYLNNRNSDTEGAQLLQNALDIKESGLPTQQMGQAPVDTATETAHLTNSQAEKILKDPAKLAELGLTDTEDMKIKDARTAVKQAVGAQNQAATQNMTSEADTHTRIAQDKAATVALGKNGAKAFRFAYTDTVAATVDGKTAAAGFQAVYAATLAERKMTATEAAQAAAIPNSLVIAAESSAKKDRKLIEQTGIGADISTATVAEQI